MRMINLVKPIHREANGYLTHSRAVMNPILVRRYLTVIPEVPNASILFPVRVTLTRSKYNLYYERYPSTSSQRIIHTVVTWSKTNDAAPFGYSKIIHTRSRPQACLSLNILWRVHVCIQKRIIPSQSVRTTARRTRNTTASSLNRFNSAHLLNLN